MIISLLKMIIRLPVINQIISGSVLFILSFYSLKYGFNLLYTKTNFIPLTSLLLINLFFSFSLSLCAFWSYGQKVGQYFLKSLIKMILFFVPMSFILFKLKIKYSSSFLLYSVLLLSLTLPILAKILNKRKKTALNKTMSEIDNFGRSQDGTKNTKIAGDLFEEYIRDCFKILGYEAYTTTEMKLNGTAPKGLEKLSGDGGADIIASRGDEKLVIQCKHYSNTVGVEACYQAHGALNVYKGNQAMVITNHFFTEEAKFNAQQNNIILIDRLQLTQFIAEVSKISEKNKTEPTLLNKLIKKDLKYKKAV